VATEWIASRTRVRALVVSALLIVVAIGLFSTAFDPILDRFTDDPLLAPRLPAWAGAATIIRHFPFLGTGWNTYGVATLLSESADANLPFHFDAAHSDYLQLVAECGLIGTGVALFLVVAFGRQAIARARRDTRDTLAYWIRRGAIIGLIGIASQELVEFSLQIPANALLCALLCGLALHVPAGPTGTPLAWSFPQLAAATSASRSTTVH
jgi:O-antigen ligase